MTSNSLVFTDTEIRWLGRMPEALQLLIDRYHVDIAEADAVGFPECVKYDERRQKELAAERDAKLIARGDSAGELNVTTAHEPPADHICGPWSECDAACADRASPPGVKCTHCNGSGEETQVYDEQNGWSDEKPCGTCNGTGRITTVDQYLKTLPANWHENSSLETWFPCTAAELERLRAAEPPTVSANPNEGPIGGHGFVEVADGVLPAFHNHWSCSQCGRRAEYVKENGCPESCGRTAPTKSEPTCDDGLRSVRHKDCNGEGCDGCDDGVNVLPVESAALERLEFAPPADKCFEDCGDDCQCEKHPPQYCKGCSNTVDQCECTSGETSTSLCITLTCEGCATTAELPRVGKEKDFVSIIPANGWQLYPRHLCPKCSESER